MTRPPHMNGSNGGKPPMDQRKMSGYGSGISGVSRKPPTTSLGNSTPPPPSMQQGLRNASAPNPPPASMNIGKMPTTPRFSNEFGKTHAGPSMNAPAYNTMPQAPMQVAPFGDANNQKPTFGNRMSNGWAKTKKLRPLLIFSTIAGVTYLGLRTLSGGRSASRDDPDDSDDLAIDSGESYR